jgi:hypothetical protein
MKILSWPRAAPEPPPGVEVTDINGFMVSLGRGDRPFVMMSSSCDNPDCPCTEIHLGFIEVTPAGPEHGLRFAFDLDTNTWQEPTSVSPLRRGFLSAGAGPTSRDRGRRRPERRGACSMPSGSGIRA